MAILNKKSMLFLLATTLLISSYADARLSSSARKERVLISPNSILTGALDFNTVFSRRNAEKIGSALEKSKSNFERAKKSYEFTDTAIEFASSYCTLKFCSGGNFKCDGLSCLKILAANENINCTKDCSGK